MTAGKRFSSEFTMLTILEYLVLNSRTTPLSKYHIATKIAGIRQQRRDRISNMMDLLESNGLVKSITTPNAVFYQVTDKGLNAYVDWVKPFLEFTRDVATKGDVNNEDDKGL